MKLTDGYTILPEGTYIFKVRAVEYKPQVETLILSLETHDGQRHIERIYMKDKEGNIRQGVVNRMSFIVRTILNDWNVEELTTKVARQLIGKYFKAVVSHYVGERRTYVNLNDIKPAEGFEDLEETAEEEADDEGLPPWFDEE